MSKPSATWSAALLQSLLAFGYGEVGQEGEDLAVTLVLASLRTDAARPRKS